LHFLDIPNFGHANIEKWMSHAVIRHGNGTYTPIEFDDFPNCKPSDRGFPSHVSLSAGIKKMFVIDPMSSEKSHHSIPMFPTVACILVAISKGVSTFGLIQGSGTLCWCPICGKHNNKSWLNRGLLLGIPRIKHDNNHKNMFLCFSKNGLFSRPKRRMNHET
jgi:hypothetical protein